MVHVLGFVFSWNRILVVPVLIKSCSRGSRSGVRVLMKSCSSCSCPHKIVSSWFMFWGLCSPKIAFSWFMFCGVRVLTRSCFRCPCSGVRVLQISRSRFLLKSCSHGFMFRVLCSHEIVFSRTRSCSWHGGPTVITLKCWLTKWRATPGFHPASCGSSWRQRTRTPASFRFPVAFLHPE